MRMHAKGKSTLHTRLCVGVTSLIGLPVKVGKGTRQIMVVIC